MSKILTAAVLTCAATLIALATPVGSQDIAAVEVGSTCTDGQASIEVLNMLATTFDIEVVAASVSVDGGPSEPLDFAPSGVFGGGESVSAPLPDGGPPWEVTVEVALGENSVVTEATIDADPCASAPTTTTSTTTSTTTTTTSTTSTTTPQATETMPTATPATPIAQTPTFTG